MIRTVLCAAALSVVVIGGASAVPIPADKPVSVTTTSDLVQVGKKYKKKHWHRGWNKSRHNYHHHHRHPPRGWRSYSYRPWGWQRRGCIVIGPVWYCP